MGARVRKSITICLGVRLNIGKNGLSSGGAKGTSLSFGCQDTHANIDLPVMGLSYRTKLPSSSIGLSKQSNPDLISFQQATENETNYIVNILLQAWAMQFLWNY
ncbi:hypothetical protein BTO01_08450 [Vibrio jasicida]|uniref:DUF4236 domain-containing protein n=1 Tax=Vibrio jasicida TaxID=766224 RepID=UPI000CF537B5|nr:hypothetical protein BTO01_08450 [Vibrio jasicida]